MSESIRQDEIDYLYRTAAEAANEGEMNKALQYLEQVLNANPFHPMAWNVKGNCLDKLGKCDDALQSYNAAIKLDPTNADILFNKALTLKKMGREKEALACMDEAVKLELGE